jgi:hypothetical protein
LAQPRITDLPPAGSEVRFEPGAGQRFILTVDTEEEFDWTRPIQREGYTVHSVARLAKFQEFCEGQGVCPIYLVDYPIATSPAAGEVLRDAVAAGRAEIGVQLHPGSARRSMRRSASSTASPAIFPPDLEREKFRRLRDAIEDLRHQPADLPRRTLWRGAGNGRDPFRPRHRHRQFGARQL